MSTTSPILLRSRSIMTRPRQPRAVSMLGVAMLASFLVGYLSRAAKRCRIACDRRVVAELLPAQASMPPLPPVTLADRDWEVPVARQTSGARLDLSYSCSGRGWLEALTGSGHRWTGISRHLPTVAQSCRRPTVTNGPAATCRSPDLNDHCVHSSC